MPPIDPKSFMPHFDTALVAQVGRIATSLSNAQTLNAATYAVTKLNFDLAKQTRWMTADLAKIPHFAIDSRRLVLPREMLASLDALRTGLGNTLAKIQLPAFPELQAFATSVARLPPRLQRTLAALAMRGWYLDMSMSLPTLWEFEKALQGEFFDELDAMLCDHFEERLEDIEREVRERAPSRARIVASAFKAHREGEFNLSIPTLFTQIDGVCKDLSSRYLFLKERGSKRSELASHVEEAEHRDFMMAVLSPLTLVLPVAMSERDRPEGFSQLNRHMVMHGESLDYGTRINGLKAVSLLNYVASVLRRPDTSEGSLSSDSGPS